MVPPKGTASLTAQELDVAKVIKDFQNPCVGGGIRFSISGDLQSEDGERVSLEDVEKNGIVTHGLKEANVDIVDVERQTFRKLVMRLFRKLKNGQIITLSESIQ